MYTRIYTREERIENALRAIIEIGKRDMSNPKYAGYFQEAKEALALEREPACSVCKRIGRHADDCYASDVTKMMDEVDAAPLPSAGVREALLELRELERRMENEQSPKLWGYGTILSYVKERIAALAPSRREALPEGLVEAVEWVLRDASYKAPEQVGMVARRWLDRLRAAQTVGQS